MLGIVLCGGQSSRMGSDKGLLKLEANTWAQTAIDKITTLSIPVKISVNNEQYPGYTAVFPSTDLIPDDTTLSLSGPLLGVLSSHLKFPQENLFILACDMPLMDPSLLRKLYTHYQQEPSFNAYIFTNKGEPEPLCGIYKAKGLSIIRDMLVSGRLNKHSMKFMLEQLDTMAIPATDEQKIFFRNFNAHAELNGL
ncbi:MAG: molybdenum cofactor guanylyltransferase [Chitinophagaceae bacterium]